LSSTSKTELANEVRNLDAVCEVRTHLWSSIDPSNRFVELEAYPNGLFSSVLS
jgi:hypothetical protein